ncbi:MAG: CGNR zinc finger domain-containing protein [Gaiellaceae bacterium]
MSLTYSWLGQELALDLANTVIVVRPAEEIDGLATTAELARWLELERDRLGAAPGSDARLRDFQRLRDAVRSLLTAAAEGVELPAAAVTAVNRASAAAPSFAQLRPPAGAVVEARASTPVDAILGAIATSAVELLGGPQRELIRVCKAPRCGLYFVAGRAGQQWCSSTCGNRARVARHYARRAQRAARA